MADPYTLPDDLPEPVDDGAADHLPGAPLPAGLALAATDGSRVEPAALAGRAVVYAYPWTGRPGQALLADDWDLIPGRARLHARDLRLSRPPRRPARRGRRVGVRALDPGHRLSRRAGRTARASVRGPLGFRAGADPGAAAADLRGRRPDADQAADAPDQRRLDRARLVPGLPARPPRGRGPRAGYAPTHSLEPSRGGLLPPSRRKPPLGARQRNSRSVQGQATRPSRRARARRGRCG